jgi:hypothetical protein
VLRARQVDPAAACLDILESIEVVEEIFQRETAFHIMEQNKTLGARSLEKLSIFFFHSKLKRLSSHFLS